MAKTKGKTKDAKQDRPTPLQSETGRRAGTANLSQAESGPSPATGAPAAQGQLPLFYERPRPLHLMEHADLALKTPVSFAFAATTVALPILLGEFLAAGKDYPIVFGPGNIPAPVAFMGLGKGENLFVQPDGTWLPGAYIPAYVRRYPFLLARLDSNSDNMSLCFDPSTGLLGDHKDGDELFAADGPSDFTKGVLQFCENFEQAGQRTQIFVAELRKHDLLMEGEVAIQRTNAGEDAQPFVYRGFKMINQEKFREVRGDQLRTWNQNGFLALVHAHLLSLDLLRVIFARQTGLGKGTGAELPNGQAAEKKPKKAKKQG